MEKSGFELYIRKIIENYAFPVQAKVIKGWKEGKEFLCNCKEIDLSGAETEIIIPRVKVPKIWGELKSGAIVNVAFLYGNKNYPVIMSVEGIDFPAAVDLKSFLSKFLDVISNMKTVGSPPQHTISPDDKLKFLELKEVDLKKLTE